MDISSGGSLLLEKQSGVFTEMAFQFEQGDGVGNAVVSASYDGDAEGGHDALFRRSPSSLKFLQMPTSTVIASVSAILMLIFLCWVSRSKVGKREFRRLSDSGSGSKWSSEECRGEKEDLESSREDASRSTSSEPSSSGAPLEEEGARGLRAPQMGEEGVLHSGTRIGPKQSERKRKHSGSASAPSSESVSARGAKVRVHSTATEPQSSTPAAADSQPSISAAALVSESSEMSPSGSPRLERPTTSSAGSYMLHGGPLNPASTKRLPKLVDGGPSLKFDGLRALRKGFLRMWVVSPLPTLSSLLAKERLEIEEANALVQAAESMVKYLTAHHRAGLEGKSLPKAFEQLVERYENLLALVSALVVLKEPFEAPWWVKFASVLRTDVVLPTDAQEEDLQVKLVSRLISAVNTLKKGQLPQDDELQQLLSIYLS